MSSQDSKARANVMHSVGTCGNIIIINNRNPMPKFKFCSVFSAKNPTVNDASGVTVLFADAGMIFGVPQNNESALHVSFPLKLSLITFKRSEHGAVFP